MLDVPFDVKLANATTKQNKQKSGVCARVQIMTWSTSSTGP